MAGPVEPDKLLQAANALRNARKAPPNRLPRLPEDLRPTDFDAVYAIQKHVADLDRVAIGGWKVGLTAGGKSFFCAPMPLAGIKASPAPLPAGHYRGVEAEVAFRIGPDLPPRGQPYTREEIVAALPTAHPAIEILESAFADPDLVDPLSNLADSMLHGGFVYGPGLENWHGLDFPNITVTQRINDQEMQRTGNPAGDMVRLVEWLANEGSVWAGGLKSGQFVTCGSWTGKTPAPPGAAVRVQFPGLGEARATFARE